MHSRDKDMLKKNCENECVDSPGKSLKNKTAQLINLLKEQEAVAVALSGGVDSALLLDVAFEVLGDKVVALTACFSCNPQREQHAARVFCAEKGIRHLECSFDEFGIDGFAENPPHRCYLCKKALFTHLLSVAKEQGFTVLAEGSNLDDESDYRPGLAALEELQVVSPLRQAGFTKADIRALARERGLAVWNKPSCACLASRIPSGSPITPELVARIDTAEEYLLELGAQQVRMRVPSEGLARIEVDTASIALLEDAFVWLGLADHLRTLGFEHVELDPQGYRMGSMNPVV